MPPDSIKSQIPDPILRAISDHLMRAGKAAEQDYVFTEEDEDAITGDFLRAIRKRWSNNTVIDGARWRWRITSRKFRGRGELATEALIGADGILQIELQTPDGRTRRKGLLFQAKNEWRHRNQRLLEQVAQMERFSPGGSAVFDFGPEGYRGYTPDKIFIGLGRPRESQPKGLGEFLADDFLGCAVGRDDVWYDWDRKGLTFALPLFMLTPKFVGAIRVEGENAFFPRA